MATPAILTATISMVTATSASGSTDSDNEGVDDDIDENVNENFDSADEDTQFAALADGYRQSTHAVALARKRD